MDHYIYCADVYCQSCGEAIKADIAQEGFTPPDPDDETSYDSGEYPKGPFSDEESDTPQHCGSGPECLEAHVFPSGHKTGAFLREPLTSHGERYVRDMHRDNPSEITTMWMEFYGLSNHCEECGEEFDRDCNGNDRCPECDGPCPCCFDGGEPGDD